MLTKEEPDMLVGTRPIILIYIYNDGYEIAKRQWISAIMTKAHISWSDLVPKLIILLEI